MAGVLEDQLAGTRDQRDERVGVAHRDDHVLLAPDDQRRTADLRQPLAEVVVQAGMQGGLEAGLVRALHQALEHQVGLDPARVPADQAHHPVAQLRAPGRHLHLGHVARGQQARGLPRREYGPLGHVHLRHARRRQQHQAVDDVRVADRHLGGHEAAHRVAHHHGGRQFEPFTHFRHDLAVELDRDPLARLSTARIRQVHRHDPARLGEARDVLEPVLPLAAQAVDEHDRPVLALVADVDVVHRAAVDLSVAQVLAPVDRAPIGAVGHAVVVAGASARVAGREPRC